MRWFCLGFAIFFAVCAIATEGWFGTLAAIYAFAAGRMFSRGKAGGEVEGGR